jgi:hypothetical protein
MLHVMIRHAGHTPGLAADDTAQVELRSFARERKTAVLLQRAPPLEASSCNRRPPPECGGGKPGKYASRNIGITSRQLAPRIVHACRQVCRSAARTSLPAHG